MQIKIYLDFVKTNSASLLLSFSCQRFVNKLFRVRLVLHALHRATFGLLNHPCVHNIHSSSDIVFPTCFLC